MADTTYMKNEVERWVRNWLAQQFPKQHFSKQSLELITGGKHEFDAVSQDKGVVAGITGHSFKTRGGNLPSGKYAGLYQELYFLSLIKATKKFLILTNEDMFRDFQKKSEGKIAAGIDLIFCPLPSNIMEKVADIQAKASREQA